MLRYLIASALIACAGSAYAVTGNELKGWLHDNQGILTSANANDAGLYSGYVGGVSDATQGTIWCDPGNVTHGQFDAIVFKYINDHPERLHLRAEILIKEAMGEAFPCHKSKKK